MRDFDETEFSHYDDQEEIRRYVEDLERRDEEELNAKKEEFQAMLEEEHKRNEEEEDSRRQRDNSDEARLPDIDPEKSARIRRANAQTQKGLLISLAILAIAAVAGGILSVTAELSD